jgi:hypothetical protein
MKKLAKRVVAKREEVNLERGWRWGGMIFLERVVRSRVQRSVIDFPKRADLLLELLYLP